MPEEGRIPSRRQPTGPCNRLTEEGEQHADDPARQGRLERPEAGRRWCYSDAVAALGDGSKAATSQSIGGSYKSTERDQDPRLTSTTDSLLSAHRRLER